MGWSTTYDDEYLRGMNAAIASAKAHGDDDMVKRFEQQKRHALANRGKPIKDKKTSR